MLIPDHPRYFLCLHTKEPLDRARLETNLRRFSRFAISETATLVLADLSSEDFFLSVAGDLPTGIVSILSLSSAELIGIAGTKNLRGELWARTVFMEAEGSAPLTPGGQANIPDVKA